MCGGYEEDTFRTPTCERFSFKDKAWERIRDMPKAIEGAAAVAIGQHLYVIGGIEDEPLSTLLRYDIARDQWTELSQMSQERLWPAAAVLRWSWENVYLEKKHF